MKRTTGSRTCGARSPWPATLRPESIARRRSSSSIWSIRPRSIIAVRRRTNTAIASSARSWTGSTWPTRFLAPRPAIKGTIWPKRPRRRWSSSRSNWSSSPRCVTASLDPSHPGFGNWTWRKARDRRIVRAAPWREIWFGTIAVERVVRSGLIGVGERLLQAEREHDPSPAVEDQFDAHEQADDPQSGGGPLFVDQHAQQQRHAAVQEHPAPTGKPLAQGEHNAEDAADDQEDGDDQRDLDRAIGRMVDDHETDRRVKDADQQVNQRSAPAPGPERADNDRDTAGEQQEPDQPGSRDGGKHHRTNRDRAEDDHRDAKCQEPAPLIAERFEFLSEVVLAGNGGIGVHGILLLRGTIWREGNWRGAGTSARL